VTPGGSSTTCAYCGQPAEGKYAIHRDGFGLGPEVLLCDACGAHPTPTCEDIWARISAVQNLEVPK
jgi:hypothetical protein